MTLDEPVQIDAEGYVVEYDFATRILGQRYLCQRNAAPESWPLGTHPGRGYSTIPVAD